MGEVYRADDLRLGQTVALKFLPEGTETKNLLTRFHQEVRLAREVSHPNVCRVFDIGEANGRPFICMEYIDGEDLALLLNRIGRLPAEKALDIARELLAGIAAIHHHGLVHRDLKPANIMLDGRGKVRITDFGLAVLAGEQGQRAGTPAYMAPEQIAGKEVTSRTDIFAVGLVLYELFTGKNAFDASLDPSAKRSSPVPPSQLVEGVDPTVERMILQCIEKDPAKRPASALQLSRALPGGGVLAATLAAGETPSPATVAAAGEEEGTLRPQTAWILLLVTLASICASVWSAAYGTDLGLAPIQSTPEELEIRAKDIIKNSNYTIDPSDSAFWFQRDEDYLNYRALHEQSTVWLRSLARADFTPILFSYRQSPKPLVPLNGDYNVKEEDPPLGTPGMASIVLSTSGKLRKFLVFPPGADASSSPISKPDWRFLFGAAGLSPDNFTEANARRVPPVAFDERTEWHTATTAGTSDAQISHVVGASYRGQPVYFEVVGSWTQESAATSGASTSPTSEPNRAEAIFINSLTVILILGLFTGGVVFARRNIRRGRGDRRGAFVLFALTYLMTMFMWLLLGHFVADLSSEYLMFLRASGESLMMASFVWLSYMTVEPYVRRHWPSFLVSWARLTSGKVRDRIVGRDLLAGMAMGGAVAALNQLTSALPYWIDISNDTPWNLNLHFLTDLRHFTGAITYVMQQSVLRALFLVALLFAVRLIVRRDGPAVIITGILGTLLTLSPGNVAFDLPITAIQTALLLFALVRYGLLALAASQLTLQILCSAPIGTGFSHWYSERGLFLVIVMVAAAFYAFRISMNRSVFAGLTIED
jgi:serine/threonine-protein kinase